MKKLLAVSLTAGLLGAIIGAIGVYLLTESLPEGAIMGGLLGGSLGLLIAARRHQGASGPAYEFEAAGIHDDNLVTTARRYLARGAYRDSFGARAFDEKIERAGGKQTVKRQ